MTAYLTAFGSGEGRMYAGDGNGKIYKLDPAAVTDAGDPFSGVIETGYFPTRMGEQCARKIRYDLFGVADGAWQIDIFKNHERSTGAPEVTFSGTLSESDLDAHVDRRNLNINYRHLLIRLTLTPGSQHLYAGPFDLLTMPVGGL